MLFLLFFLLHMIILETGRSNYPKKFYSNELRAAVYTRVSCCLQSSRPFIAAAETLMPHFPCWSTVQMFPEKVFWTVFPYLFWWRKWLSFRHLIYCSSEFSLVRQVLDMFHFKHRTLFCCFFSTWLRMFPAFERNSNIWPASLKSCFTSFVNKSLSNLLI